MAKDLSNYQKKIVNRYYEHQDTIRSEKLSDLVAEIWLCEDDKKAAKLWGRAQVALMRVGANAVQVANVVGKRDTEGLARLVKEIDAGRVQPPQEAARPTGGAKLPSVADGRTIAQMQREKHAATGTDSLEEGNLRRAYEAFKKKLKASRRDDESRLGGRYVTRGQASGIVAITPPHQFPGVVWEELARQGRLKHAGQGTYQLP